MGQTLGPVRFAKALQTPQNVPGTGHGYGHGWGHVQGHIRAASNPKAGA
jgi:hypothetical protein